MQPTFADLGIPSQLVANLTDLGLTQPTPVQVQAIPMLLAGADLIAKAPTGTGKTAAFLLPGLTRLAEPSAREGRGPRILVLVPTRELAQQVTKAAIQFARGLRHARVVCITGGEPYPIQNRELARPYDILVATPGRLLDQMNSGRIRFERLDMLVLDEADRMLDLGFADDMRAIAAALHGDLNQRQRTRMLEALRRGRCRVLVATDVAARGIDVAGITHVINFDLPRQAEDYVHRIGRTGRAGATGTAISFVGRRDLGILRSIEHYVGEKVRVTEVAGKEARFKPQEGERGGMGPRGRGRPGGGGYRGGHGGGYRTASAGEAKPYGRRDNRFGEKTATRKGQAGPRRKFYD